MDSYDSGSESDSEDEITKINIELKRGDDVVKKLLDLWTVAGDDRGKEKAKAC
jgi:hypothetical protein